MKRLRPWYRLIDMRKLPNLPIPAVWLLAFLPAAPAAFAQSFRLEPATPVWMPGEADSNSPGHWRNGLFYLYNSNGNPVRSVGLWPLSLGATRAVLFDDYTRTRRWIEATWIDPNGLVFAWYHYEPTTPCADVWLSTPQIGALVSYDGGAIFYDLGIVIESGAAPDCSAGNGYFAGGNGDFSVVADRDGQYLYFIYSHYGGEHWEQGVALARMHVDDRFDPVGKVFKYFDGDWGEPAIGGRQSPALVAKSTWNDPFTDAFWGPSVHWNTFLEKYVILLNRSCCGPNWPQEGVYVSFAADIADPLSWSDPVKVVDKGNWYPQVLGLGPGESDKLAGERPRLFVGAYSDKTIVFTR